MGIEVSNVGFTSSGVGGVSISWTGKLPRRSKLTSRCDLYKNILFYSHIWPRKNFQPYTSHGHGHTTNLFYGAKKSDAVECKYIRIFLQTLQSRSFFEILYTEAGNAVEGISPAKRVPRIKFVIFFQLLLSTSSQATVHRTQGATRKIHQKQIHYWWVLGPDGSWNTFLKISTLSQDIVLQSVWLSTTFLLNYFLSTTVFSNWKWRI